MIKSWSFQKKLQVAIGLLSIAGLVTAGYLSFQLYTDIKDAKMDLLARSADSIADKVDRNLFERYGDVQAFALSEPARSGDRDRITKFMTDMMAAYAPIYDVMLVLNKKGNVIAANAVDKNGKALKAEEMIGKNYADQDWFKACLEGKITAGNAHFTDLRDDPDTAHFATTDGKVMIFTAPIRDAKGEVVGVWSNRMSWKDVVDDIVVKESQKLKDEKLTTIAAYLVNQESTYLVHHNQEKVLKSQAENMAKFFSGKETSYVHEVKDQDQINETAIEVYSKAKGYSSYPGQKWTYILRAPSSDPSLRFGLISSALGMIFILILAVLANVVSLTTGRSLEGMITRLRQGSVQVGRTASEVTGSAHSLSEASTEQASALQETAAAIEEINAMIKKSSESSTRSQEVAGQSSEIAKAGKEAVEKMSQAIGEINVSNEAILNQITESNVQIGGIAKVIAEIGEKTKVINDIVFQTKLLSFNASVEAARAGEHGKGFAVVAEEVGNLAQMSGNAAKEISDMLIQSIQNVESIVRETKSKVEHLVTQGREKVQAGVEIVGQCDSVLTEVVNNVGELNEMVTAISVASREQSQGVNEITKAMNELDQTTNANATTSQQVSGFANTLSQESNEMNDIVTELTALVSGGHRKPAAQLTKKNNSQKSETSKVVPIAQKKKKKSEAPPSSHSASPEPQNKKAAGDFVPGPDDGRFEDV